MKYLPTLKFLQLTFYILHTQCQHTLLTDGNSEVYIVAIIITTKKKVFFKTSV